MKKHFTKISLFILTALIILSCNTTKRVSNDKRLLLKNEIVVDDKMSNDENAFNQLYQKPNSSILGYRLRLNIFNQATPNPDSVYKAKFIKNPKKYENKVKWLSKKQVNRLGHSFWYEGFDKFLKSTGEAPVIYDSIATKKSINRLNAYYYNKGYFDVKTTTVLDTSQNKKIKIKYDIDRGKGYVVDTIKTTIFTPVLDSLYKKRKRDFVLPGKQYATEDIDNERTSITSYFRNNGVYYFQPNYVNFKLDTINTGKKVNVDIVINNQNIRINDSSKTQNFRIYKINRVNIFTDYSSTKKEVKIGDSLQYKGFNLYSEKKLKYRPKSITDAVFITSGSLFSDEKTNLTSKYLSNLKVFNYPTIQYIQDPADSNGLIANVYLAARKKFTYNTSIDFTHSNIQDFGISGNISLGIRNVFNGAETFEIGLRGNIGSSRDVANPNNNFFNISEIGIDSKLSFPRIIFPIKTDRIIPKNMIPSTTLNFGYAKQRNVGLDKQNFTSTFSYNWTPKKNTTARLDLLNIQFVKNLNKENYFNIYKSSYNTLNELAIKYNANPSYFNSEGGLIIEEGIRNYLSELFSNSSLLQTYSFEDLKALSSVLQRLDRLTQDNLIFASSFSFSKTTKKEVTDDNFYAFKTKIESAGNLLSLLARASKQLENQSEANTFFEVEYSQYIKTEFEYIKHWDLKRKNILAIRSFFGIAIPYGNSESIPFSRSYFGGGTNDNRAWQPYSLGPGSSGGFLDFNEANMKFSLNTEFRFNITGSYNAALFVDVGNIWNVLDDVEDENSQFRGIKSLETLAMGSGFGFRKDFNLFVVRLDLGFKTYNPAKEFKERWFKEMSFSQSVINIGINYPF